jgi:signal transduction histidine kinase
MNAAGELLGRRRFDVVLVDLSLPDSDGLDTVEAVQGLCDGCAIVVLTGREDERLVAEVAHVGAQDYLLKSDVTPRLLSRVLRYAKEREASEHALRLAEAYRQQVLTEMLHAEERERLRIATDLHDDAIQVMTAVLISLDRLGGAIKTGDTEHAQTLHAAARGLLEQATDRTRRLVFELRPPLLSQQGLRVALEQLVSEIASEAGFGYSVVVPDRRYPHVVEELVYRTVQEALANVRTHAEATTVTVEIDERETRLYGLVADDGCGFVPEERLDRTRNPLHFGVDAMVERVRFASGKLDVQSAPGQGTRVSFQLPLAIAPAENAGVG